MSTVQQELARSAAPSPLSGPGIAADAASHPLNVAVQTVRPPTRRELTSAGLSLLIHLVLMLILLALLVPARPLTSGTSIDGAFGADEGNGEPFDTVTIGSPDVGKGQD